MSKKKLLLIISVLITILLSFILIVKLNDTSETAVKQVSKQEGTENTTDEKEDINIAESSEEIVETNSENTVKDIIETNNEDNKNDVNIEEVSDKYTENYFDGYKEMQEIDNKENILIITSENKVEEGYGATKIVKAPNDQYFLQYNSEEEKNSAIDSFKKDDKIVSVEENIIYTTLENEEENIEDEQTNQEKEINKNDKIKGVERTVSNTNLEEKKYNSWGIKAMGLDNAPEVIGTGNAEEVTVAIIDTGCDMELFNKNYSGKIVETYNVLNPGEEMVDTDGHGTHIAGTIAEGTPSNVKILPVKVAEDGKHMYLTDIITAINYIVQNDKADVINMSYGTHFANTSEQNAIIAAKEADIICVAAAGNNGSDERHFPSGYAETISIAACDYYLDRAEFSNYGNTISFIAPGDDILSLNGTKSGTSMATPHAVSAVAMLKSYNKNYTLEEVISSLKNYAIDLGETGYDEYYGWGFISFNEIVPCECECEECNGIACACFNKIELDGEIALTDYNFGSITNLTPVKVKITKGLGVYNTSLLEALGDYDTNYLNRRYNPYKTDDQNVEVLYEKTRLTLHIEAIENYENVWEYEILEDNTIKLTDVKDESSLISILSIPETIDGYTVTGIDASLNSKIKENLKKLVIHNSFKKIGDYVFQDCTNLEKIRTVGYAQTIPIELGNYTFSGCSKLTFPELSQYSVNLIGNLGVGTFEDCTSLQLDQILFGSEILCSVIPDKCFKGCTSIDYIRFTDVTYIGREAFKDCLNLGAIMIDEAETIDESAFEGCIKLDSLQFGNGVKKINSKAFYGCGIATRGITLNSLRLPISIEFIAEDAFVDIYNVNYINVERPNEFYEEEFVDENGKITEWHAIIEKQSNKLILGCMNSIIPDTVDSIGDYAFYEVNKLTEIVIPEGVQSIGSTSFGRCDLLNTVTIPKSVTNIGDQAFLDIEDAVTLRVYKNSYAHAYAMDNNIKYELINEGIRISGNVKSFGSNEIEETTIQLIKEGETEPIQTITVSGTQNATYEIPNVVEGNYIIKVMKNNHVTREYEIIVGTEEILQDLKIHLLGDINGDGKINNSDVLKANLQSKGNDILSEYELLCADISGDDKVNNSDVIKINLYATGKITSW